jgi:hypothetical protein
MTGTILVDSVDLAIFFFLVFGEFSYFWNNVVKQHPRGRYFVAALRLAKAPLRRRTFATAMSE